jgi:hypothetical protein
MAASDDQPEDMYIIPSRTLVAQIDEAVEGLLALRHLIAVRHTAGARLDGGSFPDPAPGFEGAVVAFDRPPGGGVARGHAGLNRAAVAARRQSGVSAKRYPTQGSVSR